MMLCQTCKKEVHSLFDAEAAILSYKQNKTLSHDDFEKLKDNVSTAERLSILRASSQSWTTSLKTLRSRLLSSSATPSATPKMDT
jgi:hypothetical protein